MISSIDELYNLPYQEIGDYTIAQNSFLDTATHLAQHIDRYDPNRRNMFFSASIYDGIICDNSWKASNDGGKFSRLNALKKKDLKLLKRLIENNKVTAKDLDNARYADGQHILNCAAEYGQLDVVKYLEKKGADVNARDEDGTIALHYAAEYDRLDAVKCLVERQGADLNAFDKDGKTALDYAVQFGRLKVVKYFEEIGLL